MWLREIEHLCVASLALARLCVREPPGIGSRRDSVLASSVSGRGLPRVSRSEKRPVPGDSIGQSATRASNVGHFRPSNPPPTSTRELSPSRASLSHITIKAAALESDTHSQLRDFGSTRAARASPARRTAPNVVNHEVLPGIRLGHDARDDVRAAADARRPRGRLHARARRSELTRDVERDGPRRRRGRSVKRRRSVASTGLAVRRKANAPRLRLRPDVERGRGAAATPRMVCTSHFPGNVESSAKRERGSATVLRNSKNRAGRVNGSTNSSQRPVATHDQDGRSAAGTSPAPSSAAGASRPASPSWT